MGHTHTNDAPTPSGRYASCSRCGDPLPSWLMTRCADRLDCEERRDDRLSAAEFGRPTL